jgi:hypothetical protein
MDCGLFGDGGLLFKPRMACLVDPRISRGVTKLKNKDIWSHDTPFRIDSPLIGCSVRPCNVFVCKISSLLFITAHVFKAYYSINGLVRVQVEGA